MACEFEVFLNAGEHAHDTEAAVEALDLVEQLEDQLTVYRDHSEVSRINQVAAERAVPVEVRLFGLLQQAAQLHEATRGAFDITAGPLSKVWGFYRREGRCPPSEELDATLQQIGSQWIELDRESTTIRFRQPGMEINLGAIGKGYALDRCAEQLKDQGVENFLVHGGQSSILAQGSRQTAGADGWLVAVRHPLKHEQRLAEVRLRNQSLGTSGSGQQFFYHEGRRYGHVIDPRSGRSVENVLSATTIAPTAALADALATAFFVMGRDETHAFCAQRPDLAALLVCPGKRAGGLEIEAINLPPEDWHLIE